MSRSPFALLILSSAFTLLIANAVGAAPQYLTKWGTAGTGNGQFSSPSGIAVDGSGNVYVADQDNHRIQKFDTNGVYITQWGTNGTGNGQFDEPRGVTVDAGGNVYVVDSQNDRVQKFTSNGSYITQWGSSGTGNGQFSLPKGIAVDASGNVYVTNDSFASKRVQKFTSAGAYLTQWGGTGSGNGNFLSPRGVVADNAGFVYVTDTTLHRIQKFTDTGSFIASWGTEGSGNGEFIFPIGLAFGSTLWVVDQNNHRVQECNTAGQYLSKLGSLCDLSGGTGCVDPDGGGPLELGDGQLNNPRELAVDGEGNVFVSDSENNRIMKFGEASQVGIGDSNHGVVNRPLAYPNPTRARTSVQFQLGPVEAAPAQQYQVDVSVYDARGRLVRKLFSGMKSGGNQFIAWDGTLDNGSQAAPGIFLIRVIVNGRSSQSAKVVRIP